MDSKQLEKKESIGRGAFANVYRAHYKNGQEVRTRPPARRSVLTFDLSRLL